jgi:hypothetical protein
VFLALFGKDLSGKPPDVGRSASVLAKILPNMVMSLPLHLFDKPIPGLDDIFRRYELHRLNQAGLYLDKEASKPGTGSPPGMPLTCRQMGSNYQVY